MRTDYLFMGIDPGKSGGMAALGLDGEPEKVFWFTDYHDADRAVKKCIEEGIVIKAVLEKVSAMPKQGTSSTFKFGENFGAWQGILIANSISFEFVTPRRWQGVVFDSCERIYKPKKPDQKKPSVDWKEMSLGLARRRYPTLNLSRQKDHGVTDALHMAEFLRREFRLHAGMS